MIRAYPAYASHMFWASFWTLPALIDAGRTLSAEVAAAAAFDPVLNAALIASGFSEINGLNASVASRSDKEGADNTTGKTHVEQANSRALTLTRAVTPDYALAAWYQLSNQDTGTPPPRDGIVLLLDAAITSSAVDPRFPGRVPVAAWYIRHAIPVGLDGPSLNASSSQVAVERLTLQCDRILRLNAALLPIPTAGGPLPTPNQAN